jgi:hypothetical protein
VASLSASNAERKTGNRYYGRTVVYQRLSITLTTTERLHYDADASTPVETTGVSAGNGYYRRTWVYQRIDKTYTATPRLNCLTPDTQTGVTRTVLHSFPNPCPVSRSATLRFEAEVAS